MGPVASDTVNIRVDNVLINEGSCTPGWDLYSAKHQRLLKTWNQEKQSEHTDNYAVCHEGFPPLLGGMEVEVTTLQAACQTGTYSPEAGSGKGRSFSRVVCDGKCNQSDP